MSPTFNVDIHFGRSRIAPLPPPQLLQDLVQDLLVHQEVHFSFTEENGVRETVEEITIADLEQNSLIIPTGLVPVVIERLTAAGLGVRQQDRRRFSWRFAINEDYLIHAREDRDVLWAVQQQPLGQIEVASFHETIQRMTAICRLYPKARILIAVASRKTARTVRWMLQELLQKPVRYNGTIEPRRGIKRVVTTFRPLHAWDLNQWDFLLLPHAEQILGRVAQQGIGAFGLQAGRLYAFVSPQLALSERHRVLLQAMAGPKIYRLQSEQRDVRVLWLKTPSCPKIGDLEGLQFKRQAYWHNARRNDFVAAVAKAFVRRDQAMLRKFSAPQVYSPMGLDRPRDPLVAVLVESIEHGQELLQRLPDWALITARKAAVETAAVACPPPGYILTVTAAAKIGLKADVIVRATGANGPPAIRHFPPPRYNDDDPPALVVDFEDSFDAEAKKNALTRGREYACQGWLA